ncbi:sensor histidine kinase [Streptomyces sporangiiformans]|uniref:histidine kinase n=1 Tax=Streptomyces sporangiiformans TaxID=2315329 RepID=A0A505DPW3_9ACTN|nr:sensor histidine kinase [Streptomyces sporangiiformans]TPQ23318.1 sensor histidine kinase [Streptomyces sporangiiformans]
MTTSPERHPGRRPRVVDAVMGLALFGCAAVGASINIPGVDQPRQTWPADLLAAISCVALLKGRSHPRAVALVTVCTVTTGALGYLLTPLLLAPLMLALYWVAAGVDPRTTRVYGLVITAMVVITAVLDKPTTEMLMLRTIGPVLWLLLPLVGGSRARLSHAYLESVQARAAHAERTREEEARLRVAEERMRIARELHDVVAHHMAVANAQAGTAAHLAPTHPEQSQQILAALSGTTSSALLELRATVGVLRHADDPDSDPLQPAPGLDRLPELISACESAGLEVIVTTEGDSRPLSPGVDLTAYRIIQEALTNATKHASDRAAHVKLTYSGSCLLITVTNDGIATAPTVPGGGFGLMGMRERAHSVGGDLHAGPRPEGGFEVTTSLPLHPQAPEEHEATL